jgi:hypothetical protein
MKKSLLIMILFTLSLFLIGCGYATSEDQLRQFIEVHVAKVKPLSNQANLAY